MFALEVDNLRDGYITVVEEVLRSGDRVEPRGHKTSEVRNAQLIVHDPLDVLPVGIGRKPNLAIGAAEAFQLIGGFSDPLVLTRITKNFAQFMDHGYFFGSYGPRVRAQLPFVAERLRRDPDTRQAIVQIWSPDPDCFVPDSRDYPCTMYLQFLVRSGKLELHTYMRSNDVWWGLAYDAFQFTQLQASFANALGYDLGPYYHNATSLHIYDRDHTAINDLHPADGERVPNIKGFGQFGSSMDVVMNRARQMQTGMMSYYMTPSEEWYWETLKPYIHVKEVK